MEEESFSKGGKAAIDLLLSNPASNQRGRRRPRIERRLKGAIRAITG